MVAGKESSRSGAYEGGWVWEMRHRLKTGEREMDCIFCQITSGKIPGDIVYEDEEVIAFRDIKPQAPVHILIIPKRHIPSLGQLTEGDSPLVWRMVAVANKLAKEEKVAEKGYRLVINCGKEGGQLVPHLHLHLLGGRRLSDQLG
jgi:histidine triad (HIT) family protein